MASKLYVCNNAACTLGNRDRPGRFKGGITAEALNLLTGAPLESFVKGEDYGEGFCPNCGEVGAEHDPADDVKAALADAKAAYDAHVKAIKEEAA